MALNLRTMTTGQQTVCCLFTARKHKQVCHSRLCQQYVQDPAADRWLGICCCVDVALSKCREHVHQTLCVMSKFLSCASVPMLVHSLAYLPAGPRCHSARLFLMHLIFKGHIFSSNLLWLKKRTDAHRVLQADIARDCSPHQHNPGLRHASGSI